MIREDEVYKIGMLTKTHGVSGELNMAFTDDVFDRVEAEYVVCRMDGILVPFFMEEYRFRSDTTVLMKFEGWIRKSRHAAWSAWRFTFRRP